jgi:hypothetical protein
MLRHVALVRSEVSEEHNASIIRATRIAEQGITLAVTSNQSMLKRRQKSFSSEYNTFLIILLQNKANL